LVPLRFGDRVQSQFGYEVSEEGAKSIEILETPGFAAERLNDPFTSGNGHDLRLYRRLRGSTLAAEFRGAQNLGAAIETELRFALRAGGGSDWNRRRRRSGRGRGLLWLGLLIGLLHGAGHGLGHSVASAEAGADAGDAPFVGGGDGDRLRDLELRVAAHVADHVHRNALVEALLKLFGEAEFANDKGIEMEPKIVEGGLQGGEDLPAEFDLIGDHVEERDPALGEGVGHAADDDIAKLAFEFGGAIDFTGAADLEMKGAGVG